MGFQSKFKVLPHFEMITRHVQHLMYRAKRGIIFYNNILPSSGTGGPFMIEIYNFGEYRGNSGRGGR